MGATPSVQRDAKSPEDAPEDIGAELRDTQDGENVDDKPLQKNGQISISSLNGKTDDQTEFNGHTEENPPAEVGQTETITQTEDIPETTEVHQEEFAPQVNGEKEDNSANADEITSTEEKAEEEKQEEVNEVGFKKIFRFVGFKFTLKKDKNEKTEPVQLLTVKEAESGADTSSEDKKEEPAIEEDKSVEDKSPETTEKEQDNSPETTEKDQEATPAEVTDKAEEPADKIAVDAPSDTEKLREEVTEKSAEDIGTEKEPEKEPEPEAPTESPTSPPSQETQSPFKKFFTQGIFSNLRKKASFKKPKDEEQVKEKSTEEDIKETEETADGVVEGTEEPKVDAEKEQAEGEQIEKPSEKVETKPEITTETTSTETEEPQELKVEAEATSEAETLTQTETAEAPAAEIAVEVQLTDDSKPSDKPDVSEAATTGAEILSSQEKPKAQGSPLKKLFTGAGLKKLSSKKQKSKKEAESKQTESSEPVAEILQSSTESAEPQKPDSGASSPEESGEHLVGEVPQAEVAQAAETEGEPVPSDSEKKKDGILPWSSFKKLVTPKKRVKRPSESEDEAPGDNPKSSTLSSTESAVFDEKIDESKPPEELSPESKEESQAESKAEPKVEKPEPTTEEPKRKMDTSVSWEALICVGSAKKRARKTSDSDDEEPKIEEEVQESGEEQTKTAESPLVSSGEADHENLASSPEPEEELVSTWESFKRLVTHRKKPKAEDKSDEASGPEHTTSDSEAPKEESSFSLRKLIPRRKKKSDGKQEQISSDIGSAEDDSDTPAVVPLSEYDNEPPAEVAVTGEEVKQESAPVTQAKTLAEDRSPSWISTTVENVEDETEGKQLSDIPEEGDTAATPKSTDNTIAEDIVELTSEAVTALEQVEETEMVSAVSRVTASPVTSGETTPVPGDGVEKKTDVVLQEAVETISVTTSAMAVTMTKEEEEVIAVSTDVLLVESAIKEEKTVLVAHEKTEATTVCVGLDTSEIKAVEEESLTQKPSVESVTVVSKVLVTELAVEDKTQEPEQASMTEDEVHEAQMSGGQTELKENVVKEKAQFEEIKETSEAETVTDLQEVAAVKVALINAVQQEPEFLEEPVVAEKSPQVEAAGPVEPTVEESLCAQTVEVTEVAVAEGEKVQELEDVKEVKATVEVVSVEGVAMAVTEEVMATLPEVPASQTAGSTEDPIPVVATTEEFAVIKETVCITNSTESHSAALACETVMEKVPLVLPADDHKIQVKVNDAEVGSAQEVIERSLEVTSIKVSVVVEEVIENMKEETEVIQATQVTEAEIIEKQSSVIVQEVIQNVVENIAGAHAEQKVSTEKVENYTTSVDVKFEEAPVVSGMSEEKTSTEVVLEEKTPLETSPEKPKASDDICKDDDAQTRIVTEKPMKTVNDTILITETVTVSITDEIQPQNEEVATVSAEDVHHETEVTKSEVELKQAEEKKLSGTTESEEGKSQVESHPKEVPAEIQQQTQASEVSEAIPEEKMTETSAVGESQDQIVAEQYQMAQEVQIETVQEFNVGVINVINADDVPVQEIETNMKEESSEGKESVQDKPQKDSEEPQTEVSTQDTTNQEESRDPDCQKTDAKNVPAKLETATDKSVNAVAVEEVMEEVGNEIEQVSSEVVTVS
ncbi:A-kinase anchor protein 12b isoform X2 [Carassius carassius]|uniref:A-kinase anchor protein 12b isoform X2 n=1 Tax=Carassius carassius TaxID=217509 RepID=UPI002868C9AA|nr:A-kinase anchor protein 12b isoform X2 [Carassius carassius]